MFGTISYWNAQRSFGFCTPSNPGPNDKDIFFHLSQVFATDKPKVAVGVKIQYTVRPPRKTGGRPEAGDIRVVGEFTDEIQAFVNGVTQ